MRDPNVVTVTVGCPVCDFLHAHTVRVRFDADDVPQFLVPTWCSDPDCNAEYDEQQQWTLREEIAYSAWDVKHARDAA